jgi:hypothetical protein
VKRRGKVRTANPKIYTNGLAPSSGQAHARVEANRTRSWPAAGAPW